MPIRRAISGAARAVAKPAATLAPLDEDKSLADVEADPVYSSALVNCQSFSRENPRGYHENEDRQFYKHVEGGRGSVAYHMFGVMDGHDGPTACDHVATNCPKLLQQALARGTPVAAAFIDTCAQLEELLRKVNTTAGSCVIASLVAGRWLWCANLGDCRSAWIPLRVPVAGAKYDVSGVEVVWLSRDMKGSSPWEKKRIRDAGGRVVDGRVEGILDPSRGIGDFDVKARCPAGVISVIPEVRVVDLLVTGREAPVEAGCGLVISGTDGIWDVVTDAPALLKLVQHHAPDLPSLFKNATSVLSGQILAGLGESVVNWAQGQGSTDDCTCQVTFVQCPGEQVV